MEEGGVSHQARSNIKPQDLEALRVPRMQKCEIKIFQQRLEVEDRSSWRQTKRRQEWPVESRRVLSYLASRTQQGMALLNALLLLIIFLIFPSC